jgi:uncharacterized protein (DUF1330 family)
MAKGYIVTTYRSIKDPAKLAAYAKIAGPAIEKMGGHILVRGLPTQVHEKGVQQRVVIVEFESVQKAIAAHDSAGYQQALGLLGDGAERDMRIVEGLT